jgi:hypothetical protein
MAWFVFMSYVRVVRKTLISSALVPAKTSQSTPYDAYRAREIEENASYKGYYAISYPIAPLRVETFTFSVSMRTKSSFRKQRREIMSESTGQLTDGQDTSRETEAVEGEGHSTIG